MKARSLTPARVLLVLMVLLGLAIPGGSFGLVAAAVNGAATAEDQFRWIWTMDSETEIGTFHNDNTGARFELSDRVKIQGTHSMKVIPSGNSAETKVALPLERERVAAWAEGGIVYLNVYLPPENRLNSTMYFLGMADVTSGWSWVGGVFSETKVHPGWNEIRYELPPIMWKVQPGNRYVVYLAFAGFDAEGNKVPLSEPFYLDGIRVEKAPPELVMTRAQLLERVSPEIREEVTQLTKLPDGELIDVIARRAFDYFWNEVNPENGLVKDRSTADSPSSIAAVGFGLGAIVVGAERGWISREQGYERALTTLRTFAGGGVEGYRGFFYHFVDMSSGRRVRDSELSSIDTALFIAGALVAGEYFAGTEVETLADQLYRQVDWEWMMAGGETPSMGWLPRAGFIRARWEQFNEGLLLYLLALGSPTHPIPASAWDAMLRPATRDYIFEPNEVLFTYLYPLAWIDLRDKEDYYANYWNNAVLAAQRNRAFSIRLKDKYHTYDEDIWGLSASDGPGGYRAYGASPGNHDGTIAPYASVASLPLVPDLALRSIRGMLEKHGPLVWGRYGFVSAFNVDLDWYSTEFIGIDEGVVLLMLENYRSGLIWKLMMKNEYVRRSLELAGFVDKKADYAVTPAYRSDLGF
ncbi:MAG TPA: hypothetical protein GXX55_11560 [Firmicutes bacterium]|nr:hypothetical protein [Bacillota bacterium]